MPLRSPLGRAVALALRTVRRHTSPVNANADAFVYYSRATTSSVTVSLFQNAEIGLAGVGRDADLDDDTLDDDTRRDFLCDYDAFRLAGIDDPAEGDRIYFDVEHDDDDPHADTGTGDVDTLEYVVVREPGGGPAWRFVDQARTTYRVHTKQVVETRTPLSWEP